MQLQTTEKRQISQKNHQVCDIFCVFFWLFGEWLELRKLDTFRGLKSKTKKRSSKRRDRVKYVDQVAGLTEYRYVGKVTYRYEDEEKVPIVIEFLKGTFSLSQMSRALLWRENESEANASTSWQVVRGACRGRIIMRMALKMIQNPR